MSAAAQFLVQCVVLVYVICIRNSVLNLIFIAFLFLTTVLTTILGRNKSVQEMFTFLSSNLLYDRTSTLKGWSLKFPMDHCALESKSSACNTITFENFSASLFQLF